MTQGWHTHIASLDGSEVGFSILGSSWVPRFFLQRAHKVGSLEEDDLFRDVEIECELLQCAMQIASVHRWAFLHSHVWIGVHGWQGEEGGTAAEGEGNLLLERAESVIKGLDRRVSLWSHVHSVFEYTGVSDGSVVRWNALSRQPSQLVLEDFEAFRSCRSIQISLRRELCVDVLWPQRERSTEAVRLKDVDGVRLPKHLPVRKVS